MLHSCRFASVAAVSLLLASCANAERTLPVQAGFGPRPVLPQPHEQVIPVINIAPAEGWAGGRKPIAAPGFNVTAFATDFDHPPWLYVLPNGDVLVAETNRPEKKTSGIRAWIMGLAQKRAGAGVTSADRITLLRDANGDGYAEARTTFLQNFYSPFGMTLVGNDLYIANADAIVRFPYRTGDTSITAPGTRFTELPGGPNNHHWTKNVIASRDGTKLYATVGSNSNVGENGMAAEEGRAAIWEIDRATGAKRPFATGLRNPNGMDWQPQSGVLWTVVNERDEIGDDLVPDYLTSVRDGGFYGWPYSYWGAHVDDRVKPQRPDLVAKALVPDFGLGAHSAALGLAFYDGTALPQRYRGGAFIGLHGSWNRSEPAGYRVVFVPFANGRPSGPAQDVLAGFLDPEGNAQGRPVGVAVDKRGAVLVADDVGNIIWRITGAAGPIAQR